ncbi:MAG: cation diffusion facilitator family transporter [Lachnospiraceae bacterium]|nr:cation diffusion facilitator family transporter [Lachnospiraceae bacterium]
MITLLSKLFLPKDLPEERKRGAYGRLCGLVGILLNMLLFAGKALAGVLSSSIAITADAFNNLSDAGSSVVSLVSFRLAEQKPDAEHPYGHGRVEYIAGLIISGVILLMAYELIKDSIGKILHPSCTKWSLVVVAILLVSIVVKFYMAYYNSAIGRKIDSATLRATATDSLSDCLATTAVMVATLLEHFFSWRLDGWFGLLVGVFILIAGYRAGKETLNPLLGTPPSPEFVHSVEDIVLGFDEKILGIHDLIVHDYGPGRRIISLHAEVPAEGDMLEIHDVIDNLEHTIGERLSCLPTIHMDPVVTKDPRIDALKKQLKDILSSIDEEITFHDFRVVFGPSHTNLIFDIVLPFRLSGSSGELTGRISSLVRKEIGDRYFCVINIDYKLA